MQNSDRNGKQIVKPDWIIFFLLVPIILVAVLLLPAEIRQGYFTLYPDSPTLTGIILFNFNHKDIAHLGGNLLVYLLTMFLLFNIETDRRRFYQMVGVLFILLPLILGLATVFLTPSLPPQVGFSGIVAGLIGYFTYAAYCYLKKRFDTELTPNFLFLIFLINIEIAGIKFDNPIFQPFMLLSIIVLLYLERNEIRKLLMRVVEELRRYNKTPLKIIKPAVYAFVSAFIILSAISVLIPGNIDVNGSRIAIHSHYFGYIIGLFWFAIPEFITFIKKEKR